ncbi:hypothetical protein DM860_016526 [Cuscuta australis]|uniref:PAP-associated domain-containing protein n=1 Tax=Cuscuta australis TaxID=267555 RepID=A0A328E5V5_9ASTE|nr:hypothetical protein DM860_016526 [Cuscuta australis]
MGDFREPSDGTAAAEMSSNPHPSSIGSDRWLRAEKLTQDIIQNVQPTSVSEKQRKSLIDYVQRLLRGSLHCEVFPYGSVPLKTFLPDGDLDLTAFGGSMVEDGLATNMVSILERENQNKGAEFAIEDVQLISAEVKLVKCIIQNIVVDISFNQIGGLCSLCFLEKVDHLIGKDHLFKRSILLIKAWCFYESRILGAHHGLISTYALETLILYIFHLFHSALDGPLAVLYKFLDYFSKFDWENYCITLTGPVRLSSLPEIVVETPQNNGGDFLLSNDFIRDCVRKFSVPSKVGEMNSRAFQQKHLNIVDPLKENNNLGRSVSKGNFYRIRSAFTYGARKLGRILLQSEDNIVTELNSFFSNTLGHHGTSQTLDVEDHSPPTAVNSFTSTLPVSPKDSSEQEALTSRMKSGSLAESTGSSDNDLTSSASSCIESNAPAMCKPFFAPHLFFTKAACNSLKKDQISETKPSESQDGRDSKKDVLNDKHEVLTTNTNIPGLESLKLLNSGLSDLSGDFEYYFSCLQYGQWCNEQQSGSHARPLTPSRFEIKYLPDTVWQPSQSTKSGFPQVGYDGFIPSHAFYTMNQPLLVPGLVLGFEEMPKQRGTGTYFPNTNRQSHGYRHSRGRSEVTLSSPTKNDKKTTREDALVLQSSLP